MGANRFAALVLEWLRVRPVMRRWWFLATAALVIVSAAVLALLASVEPIPSIVSNPLSDFVQPGIIVWWLVLGGPFRTIPSSLSGIAFAAATNAAFWSLVLLLAVAVVRVVRRMLALPRS
jgi:hypothetical protein